MRRLWVAAMVALAISMALAGASLAAADAVRMTEREQAGFTSRLRGKDPAARLAAIQELEKFPEPEAAKLLIRFGLADADAEVRRAAYATLLKSKDQPEVCSFLIDQLNQEVRRVKHDSSAPLLLAVLLSSTLADIQKSTDRYFEKLAAARDGAVFAAAMADLLAIHRLREDIVPLLYLANSPLAEKFVVRRAIIHALVQIDEREAIDALVLLAAKFDGEVLADIYEYLALMTKKQFTDPKEWATWWAENKATFQFPPGVLRPDRRKFENLVIGTAQQYYGLPLYARRMVFVVDMSLSMRAPAGLPSQGGMGISRIDAAKRELSTVLTALESNVSFGIVTFDSDATLWKRQLVEATSANKLDAVRFVEKAQLKLGTSTYDALQAAFKYDAEAIYLLTDGAPASGQVINPIAIVNTITAQNRTRRESIYTIGVGVGPPGSVFENFLKNLAEQNYGLFRRVDE
ncbi:MAG TPA: HEAT repeat domain-containing protein [Pirellulales bacterium]|nr:HEAT repeat domain-containing protein [Pirellulales bacterium]